MKPYGTEDSTNIRRKRGGGGGGGGGGVSSSSSSNRLKRSGGGIEGATSIAKRSRRAEGSSQFHGRSKRNGGVSGIGVKKKEKKGEISWVDHHIFSSHVYDGPCYSMSDVKGDDDIMKWFPLEVGGMSVVTNVLTGPDLNKVEKVFFY